MAKKKPTTKRTSARSGTASKSARRRLTTKYTDEWRAMEPEELVHRFETTPVQTLLEAFEASYVCEVVNILLDLKRSDVRDLFERLVPQRKRTLLPFVALYQYKEYLTNPLPMSVTSTEGEMIANYYAILGMPREASDEELKEAYRLLQKAHEPELFSPAVRAAAEETLREIEAAYSALKTPKRRAEADRLLPNVSYLYPRREQSWFEAVKRFLD